MPYEPRHSLSECLRRRHASLMQRISERDSTANAANHDELVICTEEILSIEYWLRITEEAERDSRMTKLQQSLTHAAMALEEQSLTCNDGRANLAETTSAEHDTPQAKQRRIR